MQSVKLDVNDTFLSNLRALLCMRTFAIKETEVMSKL